MGSFLHSFFAERIGEVSHKQITQVGLIIPFTGRIRASTGSHQANKSNGSKSSRYLIERIHSGVRSGKQVNLRK
jgi:hypothetical protein